MTNKINVLFVCKYNRFRSRVAEALFNQMNGKTNIKVISGGVIVGRYPLNEREVKIAKEFGIKINGLPKPIKYEDLIKQDIIVIVADNVPKEIFYSKRYIKKIIVWKIPDVYPGDKKSKIMNIINEIKKKVKKLVKELEKKNESRSSKRI